MADNICQKILSNQDKVKLVLDGYGYLADGKGENDHFYWYCDKSHKVEMIEGRRVKRRLCRKRLTTTKNGSGNHVAILTPTKHSHDSRPAYYEVKVNLTKMKGKYLIV